MRAVDALEARIMLTIDVQFDYTYDDGGFFDAPERRHALEAAGRSFEDAFTESLDAITPSGGNTWTITANHPETGADLNIVNPVIPADTIIIYVGARDLGGTTRGQASSGYSASGFGNWFDQIDYRGQAATSTETSSYGGSVAFDIDTNWHFGLTEAGLDFNESDFYSVAVHEIGHLMGISGGTNSWTNQISDGLFMGANILAANGNNGVPAHSGHFEDNVMSDGREVAMSPVGTSGTRAAFTTFDWAAMDDIGWTLSFDENVGGSKPGHLLVQVFDETGSPVANQTVTLTSSSGGTANTPSGMTDINGFFSTFVTGGTWAIGVNNTSSNVTVNGGMEAEIVSIDLTPQDDVILRDATTNRWRLGFSDETSFSSVQGPNWSTSVDWTTVQGDFNGDGLLDVAGLNELGQWWVSSSNGTTLTTSYWQKWNPNGGWHNFQVGDFNGDGMDDVMAQSSGGYWWVARSNGSSFVNTSVGRWSTSAWVEIVSGDFNGD